MIPIHYKNSSNRPRGIDLFSGAGGLSLGFLMAGGTPIGAVDIDTDSINTYKEMFPTAPDVYAGAIEEWKPRNSLGNVDVIIGGPPCQGFSLARGFRFVDDPRNHLYKHFVQIVNHYKPKWFVMENVQGITNIGKGVVLNHILEDFSDIGYSVDYKIVNMAEQSVPQLRKRAIFVGNAQQEKFRWPEQKHKKKTSKLTLFTKDLPNFFSVNDALGDLVLPMGNYFSHRANSQMRGPRNRCAHTEPAFTLRVRGDEFALCEEPAQSAFVPGKTPEDNRLFLSPANELQGFFRHEPPKWIDDYSNPESTEAEKPTLKGTRKLTTREQARLQSFPDWFRFTGSKYSQSKQIGNAVPPLYGYHLFQRIFRYL